MPAGIATGDLLVMLVQVEKASPANPPTIPTGWTRHANNNNLQFNDRNYTVYTRVADGTEGATITLTTGANSSGHIVILAYSGASGMDAFSNYGSAQAGATPTVPSVTTTVANDLVLGIVFNNGAASATVAAGWTERTDHQSSNTNDHIYVMEWTQASAGATPTATPTLNVSNRNSWTYSLAIQAPTALAPVAAFSGTPLTGDAPLNVAFTDASTNTPTSWAWDFGDGGSSSSQNPSHNYTVAGVYTVELDATNAAGTDNEAKVGYVTAVVPSDPLDYAETGGITMLPSVSVPLKTSTAKWAALMKTRRDFWAKGRTAAHRALPGAGVLLP